MAAITTDVVVRKFLELRDEVARIEQETKERVGVMKASMQKLEAWLMLKMAEDGEESKKTQFGTAFIVLVDYASISDWSETLAYIRENEAWDLLEHRCAKLAVRSIVKETGEAPPGVNYRQEKAIRVNRPTTK